MYVFLSLFLLMIFITSALIHLVSQLTALVCVACAQAGFVLSAELGPRRGAEPPAWCRGGQPRLGLGWAAPCPSARLASEPPNAV